MTVSKTSRNLRFGVRMLGLPRTEISCGPDVDRTPTHKTSVQYSFFTSAERTHNALGSRIAYHLCAPKQALSPGEFHVSSLVASPAFHHEHFIFLVHLPSMTQEHAAQWVQQEQFFENTQYITHMPKLPQPTSCAIKNHSGVRTCRVAETRAPQLP